MNKHKGGRERESEFQSITQLHMQGYYRFDIGIVCIVYIRQMPRFN